MDCVKKKGYENFNPSPLDNRMFKSSPKKKLYEIRRVSALQADYSINFWGDLAEKWLNFLSPLAGQDLVRWEWKINVK